jgi:magnesium chelatase family protein
MIARRIPAILPPMTDAETFEVTRIHSIAGLLGEDGSLVTTRPFRAPHHSASSTGLVGGGGAVPIPGEVSLAHRGVLFLDEFGEFRREVMQALRQPIEDGAITIVRARWSVTYPARFQLVAASNPCPCGYWMDDLKPCVCGEYVRARYAERLSGPVIDRIDLQVQVARITRTQLFEEPPGEASAAVRARVAAARARQLERLRPLGITCNAEIPGRDLERTCSLTGDSRVEVGRAVDRGTMSARGAHRTMRVARTIADLAGDDVVTRDHVAAAMRFRLGA